MNHNRSLTLAKEMIDAAAEAGTDAAKFQIYSAEMLYSRRTPRHLGYDRDLFDLIKEIERADLHAAWQIVFPQCGWCSRT